MRYLMRLAGGDPRTFYRGANLGGVDLRDQDLRGISFHAAQFEGVLANHRTRVDARFEAVLFHNAFDALAREAAHQKSLGRVDESTQLLLDYALLASSRSGHENDFAYALEKLAANPPLHIWELLPHARYLDEWRELATQLTREWIARRGQLPGSVIDLASLVPSDSTEAVEAIVAWLDANWRRPGFTLLSRRLDARLHEAAILEWLGEEPWPARWIAIAPLLLEAPSSSVIQRLTAALTTITYLVNPSPGDAQLFGVVMRRPIGPEIVRGLPGTADAFIDRVIYRCLIELRSVVELEWLFRSLQVLFLRPGEELAYGLARLISNRATRHADKVLRLAAATTDAHIFRELADQVRRPIEGVEDEVPPALRPLLGMLRAAAKRDRSRTATNQTQRRADRRAGHRPPGE